MPDQVSGRTGTQKRGLTEWCLVVLFSRCPREARLCSSLISILLYGGVPKSFILELAAEALANLQEVLTSEEGAMSGEW